MRQPIRIGDIIDSKVRKEILRQIHNDPKRLSVEELFKKRKEKPYGHIQRGKRADLDNTFFRSKGEANYARYLKFLVKNGDIKSWVYEDKDSVFWFHEIKRGVRHYFPDFVVTLNDNNIEYHEFKGYWTREAKVAMRRMKKYYPHIKIKIVDKKVYKQIEYSLSAVIPHWEK